MLFEIQSIVGTFGDAFTIGNKSRPFPAAVSRSTIVINPGNWNAFKDNNAFQTTFVSGIRNATITCDNMTYVDLTAYVKEFRPLILFDYFTMTTVCFKLRNA